MEGEKHEIERESFPQVICGFLPLFLTISKFLRRAT